MTQILLSVPKCLRVHEIEGMLNYDSLDIEFCVTDEHGIHILQVRPLVMSSSKAEVTTELFNLLRDAELKFESLQSPSLSVLGERSIFGVMPDWNPAEIIGTNDF